MSSNAFSPQPTNSAALACTDVSTATPIQVKGALNNASQRMIYNAGTKIVFLAHGASDVVAAIPVAGTPRNGVPIAPGAIYCLSYPNDTYFAAVCASGETSTLYIIPGEGV